MTPEVRYLVSVASLGTHAPVPGVLTGIAELGHVPVDLNATGILDFEPWESAQRHVERSDYIVIVIGDHVDADPAQTVKVQRTFDSAVERDVPVLVVVPSGGDAESEDPAWRVLVDKMVANPFGMSATHASVAGGFAGIIGRMIDTFVRPGYVSAAQLPGKDIAEQMVKLLRDNEDLRKRLGRDEGTEEAHQRRETIVAMLQENKILIPLWYRGATSWGEPMEMSLYDFFLRMGPELASEVSTAAAAEFIPVGVCGLDREDFRSRWPVPSNNLNLWFTDLMAIGVVEPSKRKRRSKDEGQYWTLTDEGRELLSDIRRSVLLGVGHRHIGFTTEFPVVHNIDADV